MPSARITINAIGGMKVDAEGFVGGDCKDKLKPITDLAGSSEVKVEDKPELFMQSTGHEEGENDQHLHGHI